MSSIFQTASRPKLAGSFFDFRTSNIPVIPASIGRKVALVFTHTWGPINTVVEVGSLGEWLETFGGDPSNPSSGYVAAVEAFKGSGFNGERGAGGMIAYRVAASAAAKATRVITNTTPATAITLTAKHEGTTGNALRVTTQDHAGDSTKNELVLLDSGGAVLETYVYSDTNIVDLAAQINAASAYVTAVEAITGVALTPGVSQSFTGGNNGATLTGTEYAAALDDLSVPRFGALAFENLTDSTIVASVLAWAKTQDAAGHRFFTVLGGALDEDITAAVTRSAALNDPNFINVGVGSVADDAILVSGSGIVLSTAQLAPRIAGLVANRGERQSLTFSKLADLRVVNGASASDIVKAYDNGVIVLSRASDAAATVRVEKGLTTYTSDTSDMPRGVFSVPRFVAVMHGIQDDLTQWAEESVIGQSSVDDDTRYAVLSQINALLTERQRLGAIQAGWSASISTSPPPSDDDNFVAFVIAAHFGRSTEQVLFTAQLA